MRKVVAVIFSDEVALSIQHRAAVLGVSKSEYVRSVVEDYIQNFPLKEFLEKTEFVGWKKKQRYKSIGDVTEARRREGLHGS